MATKFLLKSFILFSTIPFSVVSIIFEWLNIWHIKKNLDRCLGIVDSTKKIPQRYINTLVAAEDHRNDIHFGIDPVAIIRAIFFTTIRKGKQGASTVDQQFVRVVTGAYERSLSRKFREQLLALALRRKRNSNDIAAAYLSVAYFGSKTTGIRKLALTRKESLEHSSDEFVRLAIARLKYPEPRLINEQWKIKILERSMYISKRMNTKPINKTLDTNSANKLQNKSTPLF